MKHVNVTFSAEEMLPDINVLFSASEIDEQVTALMERIEDPLTSVIAAFNQDGATVSVPEDSIVSLCADNKRIRIMADDGTFWVKETVQGIERQLNPSAFLRISRFEIVNLKKVKHFDFSVVGALRIELVNGEETWGSRRYIPTIRKRLQGKG